MNKGGTEEHRKDRKKAKTGEHADMRRGRRDERHKNIMMMKMRRKSAE